MKVLCLVAAACVVAVAGDDTRGGFHGGSFGRPRPGGRPGSGILGSVISGLVGQGGVHGGAHGGHGGIHGQGGVHGGFPGGIHGGSHGGSHGGIGGGLYGKQCGSSVPTHLTYGCEKFVRNAYGKYVCDRNQKPAFQCPPVRPQCPLNTRFGPPVACTLDTDCPGHSDKCCCDACLDHPVCKPSY